MDFSKDQIKQLQEYAALFFTYEELGFMIGVERNEINDFVNQAKDKFSEIGSEIYACRLKSEAEIRQRVVDSAGSGSSNAQDKAEKLIANLNFEE